MTWVIEDSTKLTWILEDSTKWFEPWKVPRNGWDTIGLAK
jgi:hypothetical protein